MQGNQQPTSTLQSISERGAVEAANVLQMYTSFAAITYTIYASILY